MHKLIALFLALGAVAVQVIFKAEIMFLENNGVAYARCGSVRQLVTSSAAPHMEPRMILISCSDLRIKCLNISIMFVQDLVLDASCTWCEQQLRAWSRASSVKHSIADK